MRIDIVTLFPEMFEGPFSHSIVSRAQKHGFLEIGFVNPRDFSDDRHKTVDDRPYGGGPGMVLMAQPVHRALKSVRKRGSRVIYLSPQGRPLTQKIARDLSREKNLVLLCGHYEGIDERVLRDVDMEISIGDYVLTGGEIPAMVLTDAVARLLPGVLAKEATSRESFSTDLLDHPHYTRPRVWRGRRVPQVLVTGDHEKIAVWRGKSAMTTTRRKRPDLVNS